MVTVRLVAWVFWAPFVLFVLPFFVAYGTWRWDKSEQRLRSRMRREGRYLPWEQLEPRLARETGTFLVEREFMAARRWWTPDDVLEICPAPPATWLAMRPGHTFLAWCRARYFDSDGATTAFLVDIDYKSLESRYANVSSIEIPFIGT